MVVPVEPKDGPEEVGEVEVPKPPTYAEVAPHISKFKTDAEVKAEFTPPVKTPPALPELTDAKAQQAYELLKDVEANGGNLKIARACGLTVPQVRSIKQEIHAAMAFTPVVAPK